LANKIKTTYLKTLKLKIMNTGKFATAVLLGVAAGAILGVLFAPDKGSETRKKISEKSNDLADSLKDKFNNFVDAMTNKFQEAGDEVSEYADKGKQKADQWNNDLKNAIS